MQYKLQLTYPLVSRHAPDILTLFGPASAQIQATCRALTSRGPEHVFIGLDLEFDQSERPTVLGVSDGVVSVSVPWRDGLPYFKQLLRQWPEMVFVGHSFVSADWFVFKGEGIALKLENVEDTIIRFWLCNMALCKGTGKSEDGDGEKRGKGYMNLWTFMSLYTSLPNWKECRGSECDGTYCAEHAVYEYNGMDAYGPVIALPEVLKQSRMRNLDKLYVLHRELSYVLGEMQRYGVAVDEPYVDTLRVDLKLSKDLIAKQLPFSVTSPKQVVEHFARKGIVLTDAQEDTIREAVEAHPHDEELLLTLDFKELGNGPDRWFGPKFVKNGRVHSRLGLFTSSARMMSSNPNLQNISIRRVDRHTCTCGHKKVAHGESGRCGECACEKFKEMNIGKKIRRAIVASRGKKIARYDESNGENRVMLHMAGYTTPVGTDLHTWTADLAQLTDDMEFCVKVGGRRQAAKSVVHACLTPEHEVLTPYGWRRIDECTSATEIAQCEFPSRNITFVTPDMYHKYDFDGELVTLHGRGLSTEATPNHTWPVNISGCWGEKRYSKTQRKTFAEFRSGRIHTAGNLVDCEETLTDLDIIRSIAVQADASIHKKAGSATFHIVKERKKARLKEIFPTCEAKPCGCHPTGIRMYVTNSIKYPLLNCKKSFTEAVLKMSRRQREVFLQEVTFWDGCVKQEKHRKEYCNSDLQSLIWVQTIAHLSGKQGLLRPTFDGGFGGTKLVYKLSFNRRQFAEISRLEKNHRKYIGPVYCFTVPSGYFLVRYKDRIHITGNSSYLEGIQLKSQEELRQPRIKKEIAVGARVVYPGWTFGGKIVTFTGANFAERVFGDKSWENRAKALDIVDNKYFGNFPQMRALQQRITEQCERDRAVIPPLGYYTASFGDAEDRCKTAASIYGQQPVAHVTKLALIASWRAFQAGRPMRPVLQVHDELLFEVDEDVPDEECGKWMREVGEVEMPELPGLIIPIDCSVGPNWRDQTKLKLS